MTSGANGLSLGPLKARWTAALHPTPPLLAWSSAAAMRAVRAAVVMPGLFAFTDKVVGNLQMATFAAFGGFATLVLVSSAARAATSWSPTRRWRWPAACC